MFRNKNKIFLKIIKILKKFYYLKFKKFKK